MHEILVFGVLLQLVVLFLNFVGIIAEVIVFWSLCFQIVSITEAGEIIIGVVQFVIVKKQISQQGEYFVFEAFTAVLCQFHQ